MTMQVGMVARNGIVLASDRKVTRDLTLDHERDAVCLGHDQLKIEYRPDQRIAISCADDLLAARALAGRIMDELKDNRADEGVVINAIKRAAREMFFEGRRRVQCLIAVKCPEEWSLFKYSFLPNDQKNSSCEWNEMCEPELSYEFAGHPTNPAIFWASKYHDDRLDVEKMTPIAAHLILCASVANSRTIEGLDVVQCTDDGIFRLGTDAIRDLKNKSEELEKAIRAHFDIPHFSL